MNSFYVQFIMFKVIALSDAQVDAENLLLFLQRPLHALHFMKSFSHMCRMRLDVKWR